MQHIHFIGIGGSGLSAIARLLAQSGVSVSGSDRTPTPLTHELVTEGIRVFIGHASANVAGADLVVRSSAVPDDNPEVQAARAANIPVLKRSDFLERLMAGRQGIAVAGTHGKTTTTAMIAWMTTRLGLDPSYIIGGISSNLGSNAHAGTGAAFIIEADEYDRMFLGLSPALAVVTYLEHDHPDCYPSMADYTTAFEQFVGRLQPGGVLLTCADNPAAAALASAVPTGCRACTYGLHAPADYTISNLRSNEQGGFSFEAFYHETPLASLNLQVAGEHNASNALAALAAAHQLALPLNAAAAALDEFSGTGRRFDVQGQAAGVTVIDDYAHHPTEIRTTLAAARARYPGRGLWAVWQPHTFSRTRTLQNEFQRAFDQADHVIVTEIYAAREKDPGFSSASLVAQMNHPAAAYAPTLQAAGDLLLEQLKSGDVLLVLSAGDADQISARVLAELKKRENHE